MQSLGGKVVSCTEGGLKVMPVMSVARFERFFRIAAGLDVDKKDLKRYSDFVNQKTHDLLIRGKATAKANGRDIIEPFDLPITKGLQERIMISGISTRRLS
jgi:hypothetical protein